MKVTYLPALKQRRPEQLHVLPLTPPKDRAPSELPPPATFKSGRHSPCRLVNEQQNSRSAPLPEGSWSVGWKTEVLPNLTPRFVLHDGTYTIIQAASWQIYDKDGKRVGTGQAGPGQVLMDSASGLSYAIDRNGVLSANQLVDGKRRFVLSGWGGELSAFSLVQKRGADLLLASYELPKSSGNPHFTPPPQKSVLELFTFVEPLEYEPGEDLTNATSRALFIEAAPLFAARSRDTVVAAASETLLFIDYDLNKVRSAYDLGAKPLALSLDEVDHAYLIVDSAGGRKLIKVDAKGALVFSAPLPASSAPFPHPPVVGYDHRVFVIADSQVLAFSPAGGLQWQRPLSSNPGGMVITPAGTLLVSDGAEMAVFLKDGERKRLFDFGKEQLTTPPVVTEKGEILVASQTHLFQLRAK